MKLEKMMELVPKPKHLPTTIRTILASNKIGERFDVNGWIRTVRKHKNNWFLKVTDGSINQDLQIVIPPLLKSSDLNSGAAINCQGFLLESRGHEQKVEIVADTIKTIWTCPGDIYPIQKKDHSPEFFRNNLHLRLRTDQFSQLCRVKSRAFFELINYLNNNDFQQIFPPIITEHDCEGGGESFEVKASKQDFFGRPAYLTVSAQFHAEIGANSISRVFSFSPIFRAENHHTTKHLAEFWMLEVELAFINELEYLEGILEGMIKDCTRNLIEKKLLTPRQTEKSSKLLEGGPFQKITYSEAIEILQKHHQLKPFLHEPKWGNDLQKEHETFLAEVVAKGPVFIKHYPKSLKPFYMKARADDDAIVECIDLIFPEVGEVAGGSLRQDNHDELSRILEEKLPISHKSLEWYLELRRYGGTPHGGFGLGFERYLQYICDVPNIRDIVMIPRYPGVIKF